ncbi:MULTISPECIES: Flp pilus assembly protein CpaB [Gordonibacter]|uniref:Flp pilus assembly protein CpaB n=1 Tax=Gordonibacter faecis TaxID=3047475 RepID=A0ABT7DP23_9ACTN|nr:MULTISPECIES: Flp pilus assembly protein CpaB [unclassified Gordonibacter]MDJ1650281.1 Flp pilus assembly protein CpaB [Gordonibacter sp. KGMB12511]HIW76873.1 Flp pilus assembly protein CpaB [Candidatus Gordonibacter avicola]
MIGRRRAQGAAGGYASRSEEPPQRGGSDVSATTRLRREDMRAPREQNAARPLREDAGAQPARRVFAPREGADTSDTNRVKRLAAVAGVSVAVALVAAAYGTWAALSAQAAIAEAGADAQPTLVAVTDIRAGEELAASSFEIRSVPRSLRAKGALGPEALKAEAGAASVAGKQALVDIAQGAQVTPASVAGGLDSGFLAGSLASGMQAVTVAVDAETGIAGLLRPSDRVRVVALESAASGETVLTTLCEAARVLALDADRSGEGGAYASVTVEVTPEQADAVRSAQHAGKVSLVLLSALDVSPGGGAGGGAVEDPAAAEAGLAGAGANAVAPFEDAEVSEGGEFDG